MPSPKLPHHPPVGQLKEFNTLLARLDQIDPPIENLGATKLALLHLAEIDPVWALARLRDMIENAEWSRRVLEVSEARGALIEKILTEKPTLMSVIKERLRASSGLLEKVDTVVFWPVYLAEARRKYHEQLRAILDDRK